MRITWLLGLMTIASLRGAAATAQSRPDSLVRPYDDTRAEQLFGDLMSPFCPGLTLATCPSPGADSLRGDIRMRLALGESPRQIRTAYAATWGEEILGTPPWRGWGVVLWLAPWIVLAAAAVGTAAWIRRARRREARAPTAAAPGDADATVDEGLRKRLAEELAAFDDR
jgi:cytochrome c-type biogenesis protein CcmH